MSVAVNYSINSLSVKELYSNVGMNYKATILQPSINEALKAVTSQYTAEELILKRPEVSIKMREAVSFNAAIEAK